MGRLSRKHTWLFAIAGTVSLAAVAVALLCVPVAHIDKNTCDQILPGMKVSEAEAIIGGPPGWYDGVGGISTNAPAEKGGHTHWYGSQGEIMIGFDARRPHAEPKGVCSSAARHPRNFSRPPASPRSVA